MAKMSFEEYLQARAEYNDYLKGQPDPEKDPKPEDPKPEKDPKPEDPKTEEDPKPAEDPAPENDLQKQLDEIKAAMAVMAKALQPSLGDIQPVGIDDVVKKFFDVK